MAKIYFSREFREVEVEEGEDLRSIALRHGINLYPGMLKYLNCRGRGFCGTCRVRVHNQEVASEPTKVEKAKIPQTDPSVRLACQCFVYGDCEVQSFPRVKQGWMQHKVYQHLVEE